MGPHLQREGARRTDLPPHRRRRPLFAPEQAQALLDAVHLTEPIDHGLSGHGWTLRKLRSWVMTTFGDVVSRNAIGRVLHAGGLTWKRIKKLLGKAKPGKRVEHVERLAALFEQVRRREVTLISVDESHLHQDLDEGYTSDAVGIVDRPWPKFDLDPEHEAKLLVSS